MPVLDPEAGATAATDGTAAEAAGAEPFATAVGEAAALAAGEEAAALAATTGTAADEGVEDVPPAFAWLSGAPAAALGAAAAGEAAEAEPGLDDEPLAAALESDPDVEELLVAAWAPAVWHLGPTGGSKGPALFSTDVPGLGNWTLPPSVVVQSVVGMLAMNMVGKSGVARSESSGMLYSSVSLAATSRLDVPPVTLMEAQFIYISRLPILLNQVQANV